MQNPTGRSPLNKGVLTINSVGIGPVTRGMVHTRARQLALLAGQAEPHVRQCDYEQAKRDVTGEKDIDRQNAILDALPESKRWDPVPGSTGHQLQESQNENEDAEGRSVTEQLVNEGSMEAERDSMFQASEDVARKANEGD